MRWIIGVGLLNLCGCHFNRPQFIVDPYLVELSSRFINIKQLTKRDGYQLTVLELDDHEKLKKMTSKGRPTIVSPLLGLTIEGEVESDAIWLLKDNEAPYIFNYVDAKELVGFSLGGDSSSLVVYVDEKDKEMIENSGLLGDNVLSSR